MTIAMYDSRLPEYKTPFGAVKTGQEVTFTVHLPKTLAPAGVFLKMMEFDRWEEPAYTPMRFCGLDFGSNRYRCTFTCDEPKLLAYCFEIRCARDVYTMQKGLDGAGVLGGGELWQLTVYDRDMATPSCLSEGVMYQIFPDRFHYSGRSKEHVPEDRVLRGDWGNMPEWRPNEDGEVTNADYFQGDLAGILEKLDYLKGLGVRTVYLNPIFESHSNHRYNTADYRKVDPLLGTEQDFRELCDAAREKGMSIVLDGVFSHTGSDSVYFNKNRRYGDDGAYNNPHSPYTKWYRFKHYPDQYECWWNFPTLPNVEEGEESYLDFICGEDGVLRHWLRQGAAGFRLDVADELPDVFLDRLREAVKAEDPDAAVIGEVWEDASNKVAYGVRRRYLLGRQLDSVMNYPFKDALLRYIRCGDAATFYNTILTVLENYPPEVVCALMNSLSTHDTSRAITVLAGEPYAAGDRRWQYEHHYLSGEQYAHGRLLLMLAAVLQFGLPGIPCIYYGDEAGLSGYKDPFNRFCYPWGYEDMELVETFRALGRIRTEYPFFARASFVPLIFEQDVCAFVRQHEGTRLLFGVNRSGEERPFLPGERWETLFCTGEYRNGALAPYTGVVLKQTV